MSKPSKYPKRLKDEALSMARDGQTERQILRKIKVPKRTLKQWIGPERDARKRDRALRLAKFNRNPRDIAIRLEAKVSDVERWLRPNGHPRELERDSGARHGTETRRCVRKMAELRDPVLHMAEVVGVTTKTIRTWLREFETAEGLQLLPGGRHRVHDRSAILEDAKAKDEEGRARYTRAQIREKYGCSHKFLSHLVNGRLDP